LTSLSYDLGGAHIGDLAYSYDQAGRRSSQSGSLAALKLPASIANASYDAGNRLTNWGGTPLSYDANGNLLNAGPSSYTWNTRDQLVATSDGGASFAYDALGRRSTRVISASTDSYLYDGFNASSMSANQILNGDGIDEVYTAGASSSLLTDGIGSTLAITDGAGNISGSYTYGPYGNTSHTGSATAPNQYSGRENDGDTNLYYYRARYYSPTLNRFISPDPIGLGGGMNVYAYADGDPIGEIDPLG
jgi:RHS repeat-associated protein